MICNYLYPTALHCISPNLYVLVVPSSVPSRLPAPMEERLYPTPTDSAAHRPAAYRSAAYRSAAYRPAALGLQLSAVCRAEELPVLSRKSLLTTQTRISTWQRSEGELARSSGSPSTDSTLRRHTDTWPCISRPRWPSLVEKSERCVFAASSLMPTHLVISTDHFALIFLPQYARIRCSSRTAPISSLL